MSTTAYAFRDSMTMLRRSLKHMRRYPSVSLLVVGLPVVLLLLFVYVFGGTLGAGLGAARGRAAYVNYVVPGILLIAIAGVAQGTAISVSMDMAEGIIARFRTMGIARAAVLAGHVLGSTIQTMAGLVIVVGVALAIGFRPNANVVEWVAVAAILALITFSVTWLSAALGLRAKSVEAASNLAMPLILLVFIGSGFVPTASMPGGLRVFAQYQPFTPVAETIRGLLTGTPIGNQAAVAVVWCVAIGLVGFWWAMRLYDRDPVRHVRLLSAGRV
jgi:ABC-2 type transport system permease protein